MIDVHSHILPGVDDGSRNLSESLAILKGLAEQDVTDVILTPHFVNDSSYIYPRNENIRRYRILQEKADEAGLNISLNLGNEIYIDRDISRLLKTKRISSLDNSRYILVELPMSGEYPDFEDILLGLKYEGWIVILAHPERYHSYHENYKKIYDLTERGILLQCNLGSIIGQYGRKSKKILKKLAKDKLIFCFGTDIHRIRDFSEIKKAQQKLLRYYSADELRSLLETNPRQILNGTM